MEEQKIKCGLKIRYFEAERILNRRMIAYLEKDDVQGVMRCGAVHGRLEKRKKRILEQKRREDDRRLMEGF